MTSPALALALAVALTGCMDPWPASQPVPLHEVEAAVTAWTGAGLPYGSWCAWQRPMAVWYALDADQASEGCGQPACTESSEPSCTLGCVQLPHPWIIVDVDGAAVDAYTDIRVHELMHWLDYCSRAHVDYQHTDVQVWSAERDAMALLRSGGTALESDADSGLEPDLQTEPAR